MAFTVENHFPNSTVYGIRQPSSAHVHEGGTNDPPTSIIHQGQPAVVHFTWTQEGWLSNLITGHWHCDFFAELMGPGSGRSFPTRIVPTQLGPGHTYSVSIDLSSLPVGTYHCVAAVSLYSNSSHITPLHMMEDMGIIRVVSRSV